MKKFFLLSTLILFCMITAQATIRVASVSGNWSSTTTWGGTLPATNDDVIIAPGIVVTINTNPVNIINATVSGTLQWDATGAGRSWTVTGNFTVNPGGVFNCAAPGSTTTHTFNYNGINLTNNGTFNLVNGTNKCNVVIGGSVSQTINGTGALTFNKLSLNNTGGKFEILYSGGNFTPTEISPTQLNVSITTMDSLVIKQGLLIGCSASNATITHSIANFKMGSSSTNISSSVSISGDATITVNTGMILNDATNSNVTMNVAGSFTSQSMSQSNAATAFGVLGPNCFGGGSQSTALNITNDWTMTDIFVFVGNTKVFGGTEPNTPVVTCSGNISWASSETHVINLPFTSDDFYIKTCFFGIFDSQGSFPSMVLNAGTVGSPKTFNIAFDVFNGEVQESSPLGQTTVTQISESMANWTVEGNWKILSGASLAIHSDNVLTINGSLRVASTGEIAGSETETDDTGYLPVSGPSISFGSNGTLYIENTSGLGKGLLSDASLDVGIKNRTADLDWNLGNISSSGTIDYGASVPQTITDRTYNNLSTSGSGIKSLANSITVNGALTIGASTTFETALFNATTKGAVVNNAVHTGGGKIILNGTTNQSLSGNGSDWGNVELNNAAGATCNAPLNTGAFFTFTNGILTTSTANKLVLNINALTMGGSALSCVYGPIQKTTNSAVTIQLALGKGGNYRPLSITPSSATNTVWVAEYFSGAYSNTSTFLNPITSVNTASYWTCDRVGAGANANITLQWNSTEGLTDLNGLTVARWDGSKWTDAGANTITGTASSGTIKSNTVSLFSPFTLGEANTLSTGTITGSPFCPEAVINVPFTSSGTFSGGNTYTAQLSDKAGSFTAPMNIGTLSSTANSGNITATIPSKPKAGTKYRIRVTSSSPAVTGGNNGANLQVIACDKVTGFSATGVTSSSATISWAGVLCVAKYKIQYRKQGTSSWTSKFTTIASYSITGLLANTAYEYRVQTWCSESGSAKSGFTSIQTFATAPRLSASFEDAPDAIRIYPNPATEKVLVTFESEIGTDGTLRIYNALGQAVIDQQISLTAGENHFSLSVNDLTSGVYYIEVTGNMKMMSKLIKE